MIAYIVIILMYIYGNTFISNDAATVVLPDNEVYENTESGEKNNLIYREYNGTYVNLPQEASIVIKDAQVNLEEENMVCLLNASNGEGVFKAFEYGVSFDNVKCGEYYIYVQSADGIIVDASPDVNVFFQILKRMEEIPFL